MYTNIQRKKFMQFLFNYYFILFEVTAKIKKTFLLTK